MNWLSALGDLDFRCVSMWLAFDVQAECYASGDATPTDQQHATSAELRPHPMKLYHDEWQSSTNLLTSVNLHR